MYSRFRGGMFLLLLCLGIFLSFTQAESQTQGEEETIAQYVAKAENAQAQAEALLNSLKVALAGARDAGDTTAVLELTKAVQQAEVRVEQTVRAVEQARKATTVGAAKAQARIAEQALGKIQRAIQDLPPNAMQYYVAPPVTTTVPPTTGETTVETTVETTTVEATTTIPPTTTTTTTTTSTTTVNPVSPSQ